MCGIIGHIDPDRPPERALFDQMRDTLAARGPDGSGSVFLSDGTVALGHRRLSIVDLSEAGAQPMCNETGNVWLTFNGEIYNHATLRVQLEKRGHVYRSHCDAETIIHAWEEWGKDCVLKFRGIFTFAIWDERTKQLFAARDHLGVKPFYYLHRGRSLAFASQPKALLMLPGYQPAIDPEGFMDYFCHGIVPHERAAFSGMAKLPPGHCLTWAEGNVSTSRYWNVRYQPEITDFKEASDQLANALEESVSLQLMSDVPVGTWLSGGIDSSLITAIAREQSGEAIPTLTVGFHEKKRDEREFARLVVEHCQTDHTERVLTYEGSRQMLDELADAHDEPYAKGAALPLQFIAAATQEMGLKVILAGDGADELFAGYLHHDTLHQTAAETGTSGLDLHDHYRPHEAMHQEEKHWQLIAPKTRNAADPQRRFRTFFSDNDLPTVTAAQLLDLHTYLPDEILTKVDRSTMAHGVEARVPFLDPALVELAFSFDYKLVYRNGERKALLKDAACRWLPDHILTARKKGFSIPTLRWMLRPMFRLQMTRTVYDGYLMQHGILDANAFRKSCALMPPTLLWKLFVAERWAQRWIANS